MRRLDAPPLPEALRPGALVGFDTADLPEERFDLLVVGSGIAGLTVALRSVPGRSVALVTKAHVSDSNTWYAQGGIAGVIGEPDSVDLHVRDTLAVGQGLCDPAVARGVVREADEAIRELREHGVVFDLAEDGAPALAREGGHSLPRVLHSGDATGAEVQNKLSRVVLEAPDVRLFEERFLVDLLVHEGRCVGALVSSAGGDLTVLRAGATVLATGGCGQVYRVTTNPAVATGDGVAAAWRAGAEVADLEFVQFHPTALDHEASPKALITEALRGEGAYLLDCELRRFMPRAHPAAELAPRDIVTREMEKVMARCRRPNVWLDARHLGAEHLAARFPTVVEKCAEAGYDLSRDLVPVAPAAHYMIGGVVVDPDGRTSLPGLFASGECTASGLHGANRLASNSLLEGMVFSRRIARVLPSGPLSVSEERVVVRTEAHEGGCDPDEARRALQEVMSAHVGTRRTAEGLAEAAEELSSLASWLPAPATPREAELHGMMALALLVTEAARLRRESRGTHFREDFPGRDDVRWRGRVVWRASCAPRFEPVPSGAEEGASA